jgi:hypothetical protein
LGFRAGLDDTVFFNGSIIVLNFAKEIEKTKKLFNDFVLSPVISEFFLVNNLFWNASAFSSTFGNNFPLDINRIVDY